MDFTKKWQESPSIHGWDELPRDKPAWQNPKFRVCSNAGGFITKRHVHVSLQKTAIFKNGNSFKPGQCGTQKTSSQNKKPVKSFKFRQYPTKTQEERLDSSIEACRRIYNEFVSESRLAYKEGYGIKPDEMQRMIPAMIPEGTPLYSKAAQTVWNQFMNNIRVLHSLSRKGRRDRSPAIQAKVKVQERQLQPSRGGGEASVRPFHCSMERA